MYKERCRFELGLTELMGGCPKQYIEILRLIDSCRFFDTPNYLEIYNLLKKAMQARNVQEYPYDWEPNSKKFQNEAYNTPKNNSLSNSGYYGFMMYVCTDTLIEIVKFLRINKIYCLQTVNRRFHILIKEIVEKQERKIIRVNFFLLKCYKESFDFKLMLQSPKHSLLDIYYSLNNVHFKDFAVYFVYPGIRVGFLDLAIYSKDQGEIYKVLERVQHLWTDAYITIFKHHPLFKFTKADFERILTIFAKAKDIDIRLLDEHDFNEFKKIDINLLINFLFADSDTTKNFLLRACETFYDKKEVHFSSRVGLHLIEQFHSHQAYFLSVFGNFKYTNLQRKYGDFSRLNFFLNYDHLLLYKFCRAYEKLDQSLKLIRFKYELPIYNFFRHHSSLEDEKKRKIQEKKRSREFFLVVG